MRRRRRPPRLDILPYNCKMSKGQKANDDLVKNQKANYKNSNSNLSYNFKLNKRPVSNRIRLKSKISNLKRNRALFILLCRMRC